MKKQILSEEFKKMQKLAGITEENKSLSNIEQFMVINGNIKKTKTWD